MPHRSVWGRVRLNKWKIKSWQIKNPSVTLWGRSGPQVLEESYGSRGRQCEWQLLGAMQVFQLNRKAGKVSNSRRGKSTVLLRLLQIEWEWEQIEKMKGGWGGGWPRCSAEESETVSEWTQRLKMNQESGRIIWPSPEFICWLKEGEGTEGGKGCNFGPGRCAFGKISPAYSSPAGP